MPTTLETVPLRSAASLAATHPGHGPVGIDGMDAAARRAAAIGRDAAELEGLIGDLAAESGGRVQAMRGLVVAIDDVAEASRSIGEAGARAGDKVERARAALGRIADGVYGATQALRQVASASREIGEVALQTRLVATSASVEAKRGGPVAHGFAVVAETVRDLAAKIEQSVMLIEKTVSRLESRVDALAVDLSSQALQGERGGLRQALDEAQTDIAGIGQAAQRNLLACAELAQRMHALASDAARAGDALEDAHVTAGRLLGASEPVFNLIADGGYQTDDTPFIAAATEAAARISAAFAEALRAGVIAQADLFSDAELSAGVADPRVPTPAFAVLAERVLAPISEALLRLSSDVLSCAALERNGCPGAALGEGRFLLQTRRRVLADGQTAVVKDLFVPIDVDGRLWGALRLGYRS